MQVIVNICTIVVRVFFFSFFSFLVGVYQDEFLYFIGGGSVLTPNVIIIFF